jgi:hypothetical protein
MSRCWKPPRPITCLLVVCLANANTAIQQLSVASPASIALLLAIPPSRTTNALRCNLSGEEEERRRTTAASSKSTTATASRTSSERHDEE